MTNSAEYMKEWRNKNKEKQKEYQKKYNEKNKDRIKKWLHDYYINNKEKMDEKSKEWKRNHKDRTREMVKKSRHKRVEELRRNGVINPWSVIVRGLEPKYKTLEDDILEIMDSDKE
jgi:hypothetical protein